MEIIVGIKEEEWDLTLLSKTKKGHKKGGLEKGQKGTKEVLESSNKGKKVLSHIKCFECHKLGHYSSQRRGGEGQTTTEEQFKRRDSTEVNELASKFDTTFYVVSYL